MAEKKCVTCHMHRAEEDKPLKTGGHTFRADERACLKCHKDPRSLMVKRRAEISPLLKRLKTLLDNEHDTTSRAYRAAQLNYDMVISDGEMGAHNPKYAKALLQYGILSLSGESVREP